MLFTPEVVARYRSKFTVGPNCHEWQLKSRDKNGYGLFHGGELLPSGKIKMVRAHRYAWALAHGGVEPPPELEVCHTCDNPPCQNPDHLFLDTPKGNTDDMMSKGRGRYTSGEIHQNAKLTAAQVEEIRERYLSQPGAGSNGNRGLTQRALAAEYGVSRECISKVVRGVRHFNHGYITRSQSRGS